MDDYQDHVSPRMRVAVLDDDSIGAKIIERILEDDYDVDTFNRVDDFKAFIENRAEPDIILLDIHLIGATGFDVCQELRGNARTRRIPVIFMTASDDRSLERIGFEAGGTDFIKKPLHPTTLKHRISAHLALYKQSEFLLTQVEDTAIKMVKTVRAYQKFVPRNFISHLEVDSILDIELGQSVTTNMAVLFCDIVSFSKMAEKMEPYGLFRFLNDYFKKIGPVINSNQGFVDKFIGDAILAIFPHGPDDAIKTAVEIQEIINDFNNERQEHGEMEVATGIGVHYGPLTLGVVGFGRRMQATVVSDAVNVASRLERLTRKYQNRIIISDAALRNAKEADRFAYRCLGEVELRKMDSLRKIYDLYHTDCPAIKEKKDLSKRPFEKAVNLCLDEQYEEANQHLREALRLYGDDRAARILQAQIASGMLAVNNWGFAAGKRASS